MPNRVYDQPRMEEQPKYTLRGDRLVVNLKALMQSEKVKKDLETLRRKMKNAPKTAVTR